MTDIDLMNHLQASRTQKGGAFAAFAARRIFTVEMIAQALKRLHRLSLAFLSTSNLVRNFPPRSPNSALLVKSARHSSKPQRRLSFRFLNLELQIARIL
jgi:hypothetical protein